MSFSKLHLNQRLFVDINNLLVFFWLDIRMLFQYNPFILDDFVAQTQFLSIVHMFSVFQYGPVPMRTRA